jgi:hypothetical protein
MTVFSAGCAFHPLNKPTCLCSQSPEFRKNIPVVEVDSAGSLIKTNVSKFTVK